MFRIKIKIFFVVLLFFVLGAPEAFAACGDSISGGSGTSGDPYQINDAVELAAINNCLGSGNSGKYFKLVANVDLNVAPYNTSSGWTAIGNSSSYFYGKFDGDYECGWRMFTEDWGHVASFHYSIVAVQPAWAMYGK